MWEMEEGRLQFEDKLSYRVSHCLKIKNKTRKGVGTERQRDRKSDDHRGNGSKDIAGCNMDLTVLSPCYSGTTGWDPSLLMSRVLENLPGSGGNSSSRSCQTLKETGSLLSTQSERAGGELHTVVKRSGFQILIVPLLYPIGSGDEIHK